MVNGSGEVEELPEVLEESQDITEVNAVPVARIEEVFKNVLLSMSVISYDLILSHKQ